MKSQTKHNNNFNIIKPTKDMALEIAKVHVESWQNAYMDIIPKDYLDNMSIEDRAKRYIFGDDLNTDNYSFVARLDEKIIGLLHLCKYRESVNDQLGEIGAIYLSPEYWNMGYGRKMMEFSLDFLKSKEYRQIVLWVLKDNTHAIDFYKKFGFKFDGNTKAINIGKSLEEVRYSKYIG